MIAFLTSFPLLVNSSFPEEELANPHSHALYIAIPEPRIGKMLSSTQYAHTLSGSLAILLLIDPAIAVYVAYSSLGTGRSNYGSVDVDSRRPSDGGVDYKPHLEIFGVVDCLNVIAPEGLERLSRDLQGLNRA